jgi:hypothetical protein
MIDFFEKAKITPKNVIMISFIKFQNYMMGRFDYIEELLRTMEREQLGPTHDMLKSLFDGSALKKMEQPLLVCIFHFKSIPVLQFKSIPILLNKKGLSKKGGTPFLRKTWFSYSGAIFFV